MIESHRDEIAKLEALYASNPDGRVFTHLAEAWRKAGQLDRARTILEDGLRKHPDYASAHVVMGRVLADAGEASGSAAAFRRVLELDRHNLVALRALGEMAADADRTEEALHYFEELAALDPSDAGIQNQIDRLREAASGATGSIEAAPVEAGPAWATAGGRSDWDAEPAGGAEIEPEAGIEAMDGLEPTQLHAGPENDATDESGRDDLDFVEESPAPELEMRADADAIPGLEGTDGGEEAGPAFTPLAGPAEGRWEEPALTEADRDAELERPRDATGDWIPADRWELMTEVGQAVEPEDDRLSEPPPAEDEPLGADALGVEPESEVPAWLGEGPASGATEADPMSGASVPEPMESITSEPAQGSWPGVLETADPADAADGVAAPVESGDEVMAGLGAGSAEEAGGQDPTGPAVEAAGADWGYDDESGDLVITETLAEIYASQGLYERAIVVYRRLVEERPSDGRAASRLSELERLLEHGGPLPAEAPADEADETAELWLERVESAWTGGHGAAGLEETPYAWRSEGVSEETEGAPVGEYFRALLGWRPSGEPRGAAVAGAAAADAAGAAEQAFDEWFGGDPQAGTAEGGVESDEDLEIFRSWLKSLKK